MTETLTKKDDLPIKIQILYGIGVSYAIVDQIFAQWVLYYYLPPSKSGLEPLLPPILISVALLIARFIDVILEPIVGYWSDKFQSRWGRRIPFIVVGALPLSLATIAFFYPIKDGNLSTFVYLSLAGSFFFIFYTIVSGPYNALIPDISQNSDDRINLSTWQSVFRLIFTAIAMIIPGAVIELAGGGEQGVRVMVIGLSVLSFAGLMVTSFTVSETKYATNKAFDSHFFSTFGALLKNKPFVLYLFGYMFFFLGFNTLRASMNYYVEDIMGMGKAEITYASGLLFGFSALAFYPTNKLCKRIGYKGPMLWSLILLIIFTAALFFLGKVIPVEFGFVLFALMGIPIAGAAFIFPPAMLSEMSAVYSERTGKYIEGMLFGLQGLFLKMAFLVSIFTLPIILVFGSDLSFLESITTTPENVERLGVYATSLFAIVTFVLSYVFYSFYTEEIA